MENKQNANKQLNLPQWNSKFSFSAQKQPQGSKDEPRPTPGGLGKARRVPVAEAKGGHECQRLQCKDAKGPALGQGGDATPLEAQRTPTLCLFERFERLTLAATPAASTGITADCRPGALPSSEVNADSDRSTVTSCLANSESGAPRPRHVRHSVAFGTPSVLAYTPAAAPAGDAFLKDGEDTQTPLWSNAGHTPYSLAGSSSSLHRSSIQELADADEDGAEECARPLITAAGSQCTTARAATTHGGAHSDVRVELFTSLIHNVTEEAAEHTPAAAGPRCHSQVPLTTAALCDGETQVAASCSTTTAVGVCGARGRGEPAAQPDPAHRAADTPEVQQQLCLVPPQVAATDVSSESTPPTRRGTAAPCASTCPGVQDCHAVATGAACSPEDSGTFNGFTQGASADQQAANTTPTLFNKHSVESSRVQHLLAGAVLHASSSDGSTAPASPTAAKDAAVAVQRTPHIRHLPLATPKSKLRQPARVALDTRTALPMEVSRLLDHAEAATAAATVLGHREQHEDMLGSCSMLSPVRARGQIQHVLGASDQVLTPVRRSARKVKGGAHAPSMSALAVQPMLEATNFCYQPNDTLQK